jgi:ApaG protein
MPTAITENIKVSVKAQYEDMYSNPERDKFAFSYEVRIENDGPVPIKLMSRHWYIIDTDLYKREVKGEGVVGEMPVIQPGEVHTYTSWCPLATDIGVMYGYYNFVRLSDQQNFKVRIPLFQMVATYRLN